MRLTLLLSFAVGVLGQAAEPPVTALCFSPEGQYLVAGSQSGVEVLEWPSLTSVRSIQSSLRNVHDICIVDQKVIVVGGTPSEAGQLEIRLWPSGELFCSYSDGTDVFYDVAAEGELLAVAAGDHKIRILAGSHSDSARVVDVLEGHSRRVLAVEFIRPADGSLLLSSAGSDQTIRVWEMPAGPALRRLDNHTGMVRSLAARPADERLPLIASAGGDRTVRFWQPTIGRLVRFAKLAHEPLEIDWVSGGNLLAAACTDGKLRIVDSVSVAVVATVPAVDGWAYSLAAHPSLPEVAIGGEDGQIKRVNLATLP